MWRTRLKVERNWLREMFESRECSEPGVKKQSRVENRQCGTIKRTLNKELRASSDPALPLISCDHSQR